MSNKFKGGVLLALAAIMVAGLIAYYFGKQIAPPPKSFNVHQSNPDQSDKAQAESEDWEMTLQQTGLDNKVLDNGLQAIKKAKTNNEARSAAEKWINEIKRNPYTLAGMSRILLEDQTIKAQQLYVKKDGKIMASAKAKEVVDDLVALLATTVVSKASAEEVVGHNTGLADGQIVRSENPIVGDKTAIKLVGTMGKQKGKTYYVLARCGNLVVPEKTPVAIPVGKTDQPEPEYQNFQATKEWKNVPEGTIVPAVTFQLVRDDKVIVGQKVLRSGQRSISFGKHIVKTVDGRRHTYTVQEIVPAGYEMSRNGNHFVNTYTPTPVPKPVPKAETTNVTVRKDWVKEHLDPNRPTSVKVNLLQDGRVYDTVRLNDNNSWQHTFSKLPVYNNKGGRHRYEVKEVDIPINYSPSYQIMTGGFIIINTYYPPKTPPTLTPKSDNPGDYKYPTKKPGNNQVNPSQAENTPPRELRNEEKAKPASKEKSVIEKEEVKEYKEGKTAEERHEMAVKEAEPLPGGEDLPPNDGEIEPPSNPNGP